MIKAIMDFIKWESSGGVILVIMAILALIVSNSPLSHSYEELFAINFTISFGNVGISKPLILWINDGLMAIFFLLVGLEIKRELIEGELNSPAKAILPGVAAIGGMIAPALIYVAVNYNDPVALHGWAIPAATDIAFALGLLSLLGSRVPLSLKVFLTAIAILDDLGAILIIAVFYTEGLSVISLALALVCLSILVALNRFGVTRFSLYALVGIIMWVCVLKSGVHATLAGVAIAMTYPMRSKKNPDHSPLKELEHGLNPWIAWAVLPIFAFANAGVPFTGIFTWSTLLEPIPLGIALGLFIGKQVGVFSATWLAVKFKIAKMPADTTWLTIYGVAILCGIGFTMSLFIGTLAFTGKGLEYNALLRIGVLLGSIISGIAGYIVLRLATQNKPLVSENAK